MWLNKLWNKICGIPDTCCGMTKSQITRQTREIISIRNKDVLMKIILRRWDKMTDIIHYLLSEHGFSGSYICNQAVCPTPRKTTKDWGKVTCKNCLRYHKP